MKKAQKKIQIVLYRTSSIGDGVLATACLSLIRTQLPEAEILWLGRSPLTDLLKGCFPQMRILEVPRQWDWQAAWNMSAELKNADIIIDLQKNLRSRMITQYLRWVHSTKVSTIDKKGQHRLRIIRSAFKRGRKVSAPSTIQANPNPQFKLMLQAAAAGLSHFHDLRTPKQELEDFKPKLEIPELENLEIWEKELGTGIWLCVAPGAAHRTKRAPTTLWVDILSKIAASDQSVKLVFLGNKEDRSMALEISNQIDWKGSLLNLCGQLSLYQTARALARCRMTLSNDSALGHISEAVGTPVVMIFGPTVESFGFAPWRPQSIAISSLLGCRPCSKHGKTPCRYGDQKCFSGVNANQISTYVLDKLFKSSTILP